VFGFAALKPGTYDLGLAYLGGAEAWRSGHPENVFTWVSTPFLAMLMALATRVAGADALAFAYNLFDTALALGALAVTGAVLRGRLAPWLWWATLFAAALFGPLSSTLWWKQLNLVVLVLAAAGFALLRRGRGGDLAGAGLIALSLSVKPLLVLLPVALLVRAETRRAGVYAIGWTVALEVVAQVFLAWRADNLATLSPLPALANFAAKSLPAADGWACNVQNFSPTSMLCRLADGPVLWNLQRATVLALVAVLGLLLLRALSDHDSRSWELFAGAALLSPMLSPLAWSHYQLLLAPMFLVLVATIPRDAASRPLWLLVGAAFVLSEISWTPIGTIADLARAGWLAPAGSRGYGILLTTASFAQYFLLAAAIRFLGRARPRSPLPLSGRPG